MLTLYRRLIALRRCEPALSLGALFEEVARLDANEALVVELD